MVYHVLALEVLDDQLHDVLQQDAEMVGSADEDATAG